jgi:hypothetical protein
MISRCLWRSLLVLAWAAPAAAQPSAEVARGLAWLQGQVHADGSLNGEDGSVAAPGQVRAEVALTLQRGGLAPAALVDRVAADTDAATEMIARRALVLSAASRDASAPLALLRSRQNHDGGFGGAIGYESNPLDTSLALLALGAEPAAPAVPAALAYLRTSQAADGSHDVAGRPEPYVSALVVGALRLHASRFDVSGLLPGALGFLLAQQQPGGSWGESVFLTAVAYEGLHDFQPLEPLASAVRGFLVSRQAADGSWDGGDPYATALALRALALTSVAPFDPTRSAIRGRIADAQTDQPLAGVAVTLAGAVAGATQSGADGVFEFRDLVPGSYGVQFSMAQYAPVDVAIATQPGRVSDLGVVRLSKEASATTGTVRGVVSDASTGAPLAGAFVSVAGGPSAMTDASGAYQLTDVAPGAIVVEASKSGYASLAGSGTLRAGGMLVFSPALAPGSNNPSATLVGLVTRASDGAPLPGVTISVTGASTDQAVTDASGGYSIPGLSPGIVQLRAALAGFDDVTGAVSLVGNSTVTFSPVMYPTGTTPGGGSSRVSGVVVDAGTGAPLRGVQVSSSVGPTVVTGGDGRFTFAGSGTPQELIFTAPGYVGGALALNWGLAGLSDIGEVRLMPEGEGELLPDLHPSRIDRSGLVTDPRSLAVTGFVTVWVANTGNAVTQTDTGLTVFEDRDRDGRFDPALDAVLGSATLAPGIGVGEAPVTVPVSGAVSFRDGVQHAVVDPEHAVAESNEDNNTTGFESCESARLPFIDNFDDGDAEGWQPLVGRGATPATVIGGEYVRPANGASYVGSTGWTDYRAEIKLRFPAGHGNDAGLVFRARNPQDFFSLRIQSGLVRLMRFMNGAFAELRRGPITLLSHPDRYHTIRADVAGRWVRTYLNNELIFEYDGLDWENGAVGTEQDGVLVHYDDLRVTPLTVVEDFDDGNADGWRPLSYGTTPAHVVNGEYVRESYGSSAFGSTSWKNYTAEVRLRFPAGTVNDGGLVFLAKDSDNWAHVSINGGLIRLVVARSVVRSTNIVLADPLGWQTIKAEIRGRTVRVYVNGQFLFDYDQLPWENGAVGTTQDGVLVHYDDFKVGFDAETSAPDASASRLVVEDLGSTARFTVRAGLGGGTATAGLPVAFYGGDPGAGGILLGTAAPAGTLSAGQFEDVSFAYPGSLAGLAQVVAVVDDDGTGQGRIAECDESNNRIGLPIDAVPGVFSLRLATDQPSYGPSTDVHATATLESLGSLARLAQVRFVIETADGTAPLAELPLSAPVHVTPGTSATVDAVWNTGTTLTGSYRVRAELVAPAATLGAVAHFGIVSAPGALATARLAADKTSYVPSDVVRLSARAANATANTPLDDLRVTTSVRNPDGSVRFGQTETVAQLVPGARREYEYPLPLAFAAPGAYTATLSVQTAAGVELAAAATSFSVESTASSGSGLTGSLVATPKTVNLGETVSLAGTLSNLGNAALAGVPIVVRVIDPETETVVAEFSRSLDLAQGATLTLSESWVSQGRVGATYVATIVATFGTTSRVLGQDTIILAEPPPVLLITGSLQVEPADVPQGDTTTLDTTVRNEGNVPVRDLPVTLSIHDLSLGTVVAEWTDLVTLAPGESFRALRSFRAASPVGTELEALLTALDIGSDALARARFRVIPRPIQLQVTQALAHEPRVLAYVDCGGHDKKGHDERRRGSRGKRCTAGEQLDALLAELGLRHVVTPDESRFVKELRSGHYNLYLLAGRMCSEGGDMAVAELREAVRRGDGLLLDGTFDAESELDDVTGLERDERLSFSRVTMQVNGPLYTPAGLDLVGGAWRLEAKTGTVQATFPAQTCRDDDDDDHDGDGDDDGDGDHDDDGDHDEDRDDDDDDDRDGDNDRHRSRSRGGDSDRKSGNRCTTKDLPAIVSHDYGEGRTLAFAFDFLPSHAQAAATERGAWRRLLVESLAHLTPEPRAELGALDYAVLATEVTNAGAAPAEVEVAFTLPPGLVAEDSQPQATPDANGVLRARGSQAAGETQTFRLGLRAPRDPGLHGVDTVVSTCAGPTCSEHSSHSFTLELASAVAGAADVIAELRALSLSRSSDRSARDEAVRRIERGVAALSRGDEDGAIREFVRAAKYLGRIRGADVSSQRLAVARMLAEAERQW